MTSSLQGQAPVPAQGDHRGSPLRGFSTLTLILSPQGRGEELELCLQNILLPQGPLQGRLHLHLAELFDGEVEVLQGFLFLSRVMFE